MCVTACARAPVQETQGCSGRGEVSAASINSLRINIQCRGFVSHGLKVSSNCPYLAINYMTLHFCLAV